jgi:hypothetical protein
MFPLLKENTHTYFDGIPHTHIQKHKMVDISYSQNVVAHADDGCTSKLGCYTRTFIYYIVTQ